MNKSGKKQCGQDANVNVDIWQ